jgi:hypothetical protein
MTLQVPGIRPIFVMVCVFFGLFSGPMRHFTFLMSTLAEKRQNSLSPEAPLALGSLRLRRLPIRGDFGFPDELPEKPRVDEQL